MSLSSRTRFQQLLAGEITARQYVDMLRAEAKAYVESLRSGKR